MSNSLSQHVVTGNAPFVVPDAAVHPAVNDIPAVRAKAIAAYLGVPVLAPGGRAIGALCAIDKVACIWTDMDLELLTQLSRCVGDAINMTAAVLSAERLRAEQRDFAYSISHYLIPPAYTLQMLLGEISLSQPPLTGDERHFLDECVAITARMTRQVQDILRYTITIDSRGSDSVVKISDLVPEILSELAGAIRDSGARIRSRRLPAITGDASQLRSLFSNLLSNALKFRHDDRTPEIQIDSAITPARNSIDIRVRDNGIGIPAEAQERIFKLFPREHVREVYPGTGIGLTLCRRVAENHNGAIIVKSEPGSGSEFSLRLPRSRLCPAA